MQEESQDKSEKLAARDFRIEKQYWIFYSLYDLIHACRHGAGYVVCVCLDLRLFYSYFS